jgi:ABC-type anion transport system duplicated permease subunit
MYFPLLVYCVKKNLATLAVFILLLFSTFYTQCYNFVNIFAQNVAKKYWRLCLKLQQK